MASVRSQSKTFSEDRRPNRLHANAIRIVSEQLPSTRLALVSKGAKGGRRVVRLFTVTSRIRVKKHFSVKHHLTSTVCRDHIGYLLMTSFIDLLSTTA